MTDPNLDQLVAAARAGGGWAFARLWQILSPGVRAYVRARGAPDADDTTSEVFLAAFRRIQHFDGDGRAFRAWLFTIAHHKAVDSLRRGPAAHEVLAAVVRDGRTSSSAEDEALGIGVDETRRILQALTPDQRSVLLLRVVAELSLEDTAAVLGRSVGSVKSLQHRALGRLRRGLSARPYPPGRPARLQE